MTGQRISAGGIVVREGKVLLVHHYRQNEYDFWVMPGGGMEGDEGIFRAAEREVQEETNLRVRAQRIAYIEELMDEGKYVCKIWVVCKAEGGEPSIENAPAGEEYLKDARFFSREEVQGLRVFPAIVKDGLWEDLEAGFEQIRYLGFPWGK